MTFDESKYIARRMRRPRFSYLIALNAILSLINVGKIKKYKVLTEREMFARKKSDVIFIFGSGSSVNSIAEAEKKRIEQYDTMAFNLFFKGEIVRVDYHLVREISDTDFGRDAWFPDLLEYAEGINGNPKYKDTILLIQKGLTATNGNRIIFYGLLEKKRKIFRFKTSSRGTHAPMSHSLSRGLSHGAGTLSDCINFAFLGGWRKIVLAGVDLYDRRYFWLKENDSKKTDLKRGADCQTRHNTVDGVLDLLKRWSVELKDHGRELFVLNPKSVLTSIIPVWEWNQAESP